MNRYALVESTGQIVQINHSTTIEEVEAIKSETQSVLPVNENVSDSLHYVVQGFVVSFPEKPSANHTWNWVSLSWEDARNLSQHKSAKRDEIKIARNSQIKGGFTYNTKVYSSDEVSQSRIQVTAVQALMAKIDGTAWSISWTLADNTEVSLGKLQMLAMATALQQHLNTSQTKYRTLRDSIANATTKSEVESIVW
jgi:hypothetical protein